MSQETNEPEITLKDQLKKFAIKNLIGFQAVLVYGLGTHLGIFEYLRKKEKSVKGTVAFTPKEISENLSLDARYLDAWLHMALECGFFEIEDPNDRKLRTAPHVYDLLIDRESMFYAGDGIVTFYNMAPLQETLLKNFKTGQVESFLDLPTEIYESGQRVCAMMGRQLEQLFSKRFKQHRKNLREGGVLLEAGCGYGHNLSYWAKKYKKAQIVGIDIDPKGIESTQKMVEENKWSDRIEVKKTTIEEYAQSNKNKFDVIVLNQVLHEMDPDENYRRKAFEGFHTILKDDGVLLVGEHMISNTFAPRHKYQLFEIMHKWLEVGVDSKFYDEKSFRKFISSTPFKNLELVKQGADYIWAIKK